MAGAHREAAGRSQRRLNRARAERFGNAELVAGMRAERIVGHELLGDLLRERGIQATTDVDRRQLLSLARVVRLSSVRSRSSVSLLGVRLRADRDVLSGGHRHGPRDQAGDPGDQYVAVTRFRGGDPHDQARRRHDAVVRAQHRGAQPADASGAVSFRVADGDLWLPGDAHTHRTARSSIPGTAVGPTAAI